MRLKKRRLDALRKVNIADVTSVLFTVCSGRAETPARTGAQRNGKIKKRKRDDATRHMFA
jgi:hypothetical protein